MKKQILTPFIKENWFKLSITTASIFAALSAGYYFMILLPHQAPTNERQVTLPTEVTPLLLSAQSDTLSPKKEANLEQVQKTETKPAVALTPTVSQLQKTEATKYLYQRNTIASQLLDTEMIVLNNSANGGSATSSAAISSLLQKQNKTAMNLYSDIQLKLNIPLLSFSDALIKDKDLLTKEAQDIATQANHRANNADAYVTFYNHYATKDMDSDIAFNLLESELSSVPNFLDEGNLIMQDGQEITKNYEYISLGIKALNSKN